MPQLMIECPETHEPVRTGVKFTSWVEERAGTNLAFHCPRCARTHSMSRGLAFLEMPARKGRFARA